MRIGYISSSIIPSSSANSVHVMKMSEALAMNNHEVTLLAGEADGLLENIFEAYQVTPIFKLVRKPRPAWKGIGGMIYTIGVFQYLRKRKRQFDLLYSRHLGAVRIVKALGIPFVFELHQIPITSFKKRMLLNVVRDKNCRLLVVISQAMKDILLKEVQGLPAHKIHIQHDAASPLDMEKLNEDAIRLKAGYIGSLFKGRGIELILELARENSEISFYIIGGREEQIQQWKSSSPANVNFTGFLTQKELIAYFKDIHILLAPYQKVVSVSGGGGDTSSYMSPLKIFEYMSAGKAIICSNHEVLKEVLRNNENALLCDPEKMDEWKSAISRLCQNADLRHALGNQARKDFLELYTWEQRAKNVIDATCN